VLTINNNDTAHYLTLNQVSNYNLKIMRRNRIIELWDEVIEEAIETDLGGLTIGGGGGDSSASNNSGATVPAVSLGVASAAAAAGDLPAQDETLAW
jgi:hypothetical protein